MEESRHTLANSCSFAGVKPIMMELPYPPIQVSERNTDYADLLGTDYCGAVSEMTAVTQYINNENRMSGQECGMAKTILGIAMAEMVHLQKLGELIFLLGGTVDFSARQRNGRRKMWTPEYMTISGNVEKMLFADIEAEEAAITQYRMHIKMIQDACVNAVLWRIIKDEEYHIMILKAMLENLNS